MSIHKCKSNFGGGVKAIYFIDVNDIKSFNPLTLKRKYGKFKRVIKKIER